MRNETKAHTGQYGATGVANHSAGEHFPVISYSIGSADRLVAEFCKVRRESNNWLDHNKDLARMKRAECITDAIFAARKRGEGCSVWINSDEDPEYGWIVGSYGNESRFDVEGRNYPEVYADVVEKLEFLDSLGGRDGAGDLPRPTCIGSWICDGELYVDISVHHVDLQDALEWGRFCEQKAIFSIHEGVDYPL